MLAYVWGAGSHKAPPTNEIRAFAITSRQIAMFNGACNISHMGIVLETLASSFMMITRMMRMMIMMTVKLDTV